MPPLFLRNKQHFRAKAFLPQEKPNLTQDWTWTLFCSVTYCINWLIFQDENYIIIGHSLFCIFIDLITSFILSLMFHTSQINRPSVQYWSNTMAAKNLENIELLWKFVLQRESAILMYLLLALAHTKRFTVRGNNKRVGNFNLGWIDNISRMLFRVSSD